MKAAKLFKPDWEEAQLCQLLQIIEKVVQALRIISGFLSLVMNLLLFVLYKLIQFGWRCTQSILFTPSMSHLVKDEQWLYRQIK